MLLFPSDKIRPGERILIYGHGRIGKAWEELIRKTDYCTVFAFLDMQADQETCTGMPPVYPPEKVQEFSRERILISVKNPAIQDEIVLKLLKLGVEEERIIRAETRTLSYEKAVTVSGTTDKNIHIAIVNESGLGDGLLTLPLAERLRELFRERCILTAVSRYGVMFGDCNTVFDRIQTVDELAVSILASRAVYDAVIIMHHVPRVVLWAPEKLKRISPQFYEFCRKSVEFSAEIARQNNLGLFIYRMAMLYGRNRLEASDVFGILGASSRGVLLRWNGDSRTVLGKFDLLGRRYAVINSDVDINAPVSHPKQWPAEYFHTMVQILKTHFPQLAIVQIGQRSLGGSIGGIDIDLCGITTLNELKVILKFSDVLVSCEGGLVHLNHFLYNRSVVIFGPTDETYFGYREDAICVARDCGCSCNYISSDWMEGCIRSFSPARCMVRVTPEMVLEKASEIIRSRSFHYNTHRVSKEESESILELGKRKGKSVLVVSDGMNPERRADRNWVNYPTYKGCFDTILVSAENFDDQYAVLHEMVRILKVGGELILPASMLACSPDFVAIPDVQGELVMLKKESAGDLV